jgi:CBS domain-containing protein
MRCEEIMKRQVECLTPSDTVQSAAQRMRDRNVGFLPVCDAQGKVLGTLTDRDIVIRLVAENQPASSRVEVAMSREVVACKPSDDVRRAEELMSRHHKSRMMVIDGDKLVGVISLSDIAQHDSANASQTMQSVSEREARA